MLSSPLHNHHRRQLRGYVVSPPPPHPHNFWSSFLHTRRLMLMLLFPLLHRCHHNFIVVLSCSPLYHSYWYVIFHPPPPPPQLYCRLSLFATLPRLHCLPSSTTPLRLCCLLFSITISTKKLQKSCLGAVNPVTVLPKVLVYFVFCFYTDTIEDVVFLWS